MINMEPVITDDRIDLPDFMADSNPDNRSAVFSLVKATQFSGFPDVMGIYYETDQETALRVLKRIMSDAMDRYPVTDISVILRTGKISIGDYVSIVMAWGRRSDDAFSACKFVAEEIASEVPMWKYEVRKKEAVHYELDMK